MAYLVFVEFGVDVRYDPKILVENNPDKSSMTLSNNVGSIFELVISVENASITRIKAKREDNSIAYDSTPENPDNWIYSDNNSKATLKVAGYKHLDGKRVIFTEVSYVAQSIEYTVKFLKRGGVVIKTQQVIEGESAIAPPLPTDDVGYLYTGWDKDFTNVQSDLNVNGVYEEKSYTVNYSQTDATTESIPTFVSVPIYGTVGNFPTPPKRDGYTFAGWYRDMSFTTEFKTTDIITSNITVYPKWDEASRINGNQVNCSAYQVGNELICIADTGYVFEDEIQVFSVDEYGNMSTQRFKPSTEPTYFSENDTVFKMLVSQITYNDGDYEVNATASKMNSDIYYTVTFKDYDGTVLKTEQVLEGDSATPPTEPTRECYTFKGWDGNYENVEQDEVVTATYEINKVTVTFKDWDGTVLKTETIDCGSNATPPSDPIREGYDFSGWDKQLINIKADTIITATYGLTQHTVTFKDGDTVIESRTVGYGLEIGELPEPPNKTGYVFEGWFIDTLEIDSSYIVTDNVIVTAEFRLERDVGGNLINATATEYDWGVEVVADSGYDFKESLEFVLTDEYGNMQTVYFSPTDDTEQVFNADKTVATIQMSKLPYNQYPWEIVVNGKATLIEIEDDVVANFVGIYKVDKDLLNEVAGIRWGSDTDYGAFITQLYVLPVFIPSNLMSEELVPVQFGTHKSSVKTKYLLDNVMTIDLGKINVPPIYNNVFDYRDTKCLIHLPYTDPVELDINYVIGCELSVEIVVDLYTGYAMCNIYSDKLKGILIRQKINLTRDIPYIQSEVLFSTNKNFGNYIKNDIYKPYIELLRGKPIGLDSVYGMNKPLNIFDRIGNYEGYLEVTKVKLDTSASNFEQVEIKSILANGIYIE